MQIGTSEDGASSVMIDMDSALYVVKERAIYAIQLADQVDPERTNVFVPNTQQRLLSIGSHDPKVARIFLTAYTMFKSIPPAGGRLLLSWYRRRTATDTS